MIFHFLLVGIGGAIGAMLRHAVGLMSVRVMGADFPWGTFIINIFGSLCIGIVAGLLALMTAWSQETRLFVVIGVLGGFTTFSAFSLDTILLVERGQVVSAVMYVLGSVLLSIIAAFLGLFVMRVVAA